MIDGKGPEEPVVTVSRLNAYSSSSVEEYWEYPTAAAELVIILLPVSLGPQPIRRGEIDLLPATRSSS